MTNLVSFNKHPEALIIAHHITSNLLGEFMRLRTRISARADSTTPDNSHSGSWLDASIFAQLHPLGIIFV